VAGTSPRVAVAAVAILREAEDTLPEAVADIPPVAIAKQQG
jgi:hypothetical protein